LSRLWQDVCVCVFALLLSKKNESETCRDLKKRLNVPAQNRESKTETDRYRDLNKTKTQTQRLERNGGSSNRGPRCDDDAGYVLRL
jgi:hypothetical protein